MTAAATPASPLRFLGAVLGGWVVLRAGTLLLWPGGPAARAADPAPHVLPEASAAMSPILAERTTARPETRLARVAPGDFASARPPNLLSLPSVIVFPLAVAGPDRPTPAPAWTPLPIAPSLAPPLPIARPGTRRWSVSAWLLLRDDAEGASLAPGGTLGGSQAGARLVWRLGRHLALSARAYAPLRRAAGAEAALGLEWRPAPRLPVALLAERRVGLGREGRDAFALMLHGGGSARLPLSARLDGYAQAGAVGLEARDLFVDAAARVSVPVGPVEVGGGAWGAAQPGAARLDAGPSVSWRLPVSRANLRLSADWRFRVAGDARPDSGPALTLAADF